MPKGNFKKATESIVPLRGVVRDGKLAAIIDQNGVELGMPVTSIENITGVTELIGPDGEVITQSDLGFSGGASAWPVVDGEIGVINAEYLPGDVRRYGVLPDGVDLTSLVFNGSTTVSSSAGTFKAGMVGAVICSPLVTGSLAATTPIIVSVNGDGSTVTLSAAASGTGTGDARVGTWWERDQSAKFAAVMANASIPDIVISWPAGLYCTGMNFSGSTGSGAKMYFEPGCEFSGLLHFIADAGFPSTGSALKNIIMSGSIITYDRFGGIGIQDSDLARLDATMKSDATKHLSGVGGRGVHIYAALVNTKFGNFTVEDSPLLGAAANTDGAFVLDSSDSHDCSFGDIWIKDAAGHGVFMLGAAHTVKSIRVDGWGYGTLDRQIQETQSLAQSQELCGVWLSRCPAIEIDRIAISQKTGLRTNALYDLRITDTSNGQYMPPSFRSPKINTLQVNSVTYRGVSVGDRANPGNLAEVVVGTLDVSPAATTVIATGYSYIHVNANSAFSTKGRNKLHVDRVLVRNIGTQLNDLLYSPAGTEIDIGLIDTDHGPIGHAGQVVKMLGTGRIGRIKHLHAGGSSSPTAIVVGPSNDGPVQIGPVTAIAGGYPSVTLLDLTSAADFDIGPVNSNGYRGNGVIKLIAATKGKLRLGKILGYITAMTGWGMRWQGCTGVSVDGGTLSNFALGITGQSVNGNTACSATQLTSVGNTAQTDLPAGQVTADATCASVTL